VEEIFRKAIVLQANRDANADVEYDRSQLLVVDVASGTIRELVTKPGAWGRPKVSPDRKTVAFTGFPESDKTHSVADLYVVPLVGGEARKISGDYDRDPLSLHWAPDGSGLYFDADDHGSRNVQFASINGGVRAVTTGVHVLALDSLSKDLMAAGTVTDPNHPAEVARFNLRRPSEMTQLTKVNAGLLAGKKLARTEEITYTTKARIWGIGRA
jgi:dipeptidyl aminopeptidase/acylaminoacyl peptidase